MEKHGDAATAPHRISDRQELSSKSETHTISGAMIEIPRAQVPLKMIQSD